MSLISVYDLSYQAGSKPLFTDLSLNINVDDRIGLVGHNGCGKSTLLKLLMAEYQQDSGRIAIQRGLSIGMVEQFLPATLETMAVLEAVVDSLPAATRQIEAYRAETLLEQLGLWAFRDRKLNELSGGQKNLVLFARAVVKEPELLLLDEPGNHMDSHAMYYLKSFLCSTAAPAFLMISHDRDLLDAATKRTIWLRDERAYSFNLPYSDSRQALADLDEAAQKTRESEEKKIDKLQQSADRLALWGKIHDNEKFARKAKSMQKRIDKLDDDKTFVTQGSGLALQVDAELLKAKQLFIYEEEVIYSPDDRALFRAEDLNFRPGDRIALLGVNGSGKSSAIEALMRVYRRDIGEQTRTRFNPNVRIGYFDQELAQFEDPIGILDWVREHCRASDEQIKRTLIHWGFPYSEQGRRVNVLSGGERARLLLLTFQLDQPNLLIMDEPTNHIDLQGKEELEQDLVEQGVSLLFTSHDQRFIENIATRYWWIHQGELQEIHDPSVYFASMNGQATMAEQSLPAETCDQPETTVVTNAAHDEEVMLERICELETLLSEDQARKEKFQKPKMQQQWQQELDGLLVRLG